MIIGKGHDERTRQVIGVLEKKYPNTLFPDPVGKHARIDAVAISIPENRMIAVYEIKCRSTMPDQYPDYLIDADKIENMVLLSDRLQIDAILVVCYADGSVYSWQIAVGGWMGSEGPITMKKGKRVMLLPNSERELVGYLTDAA